MEEILNKRLKTLTKQRDGIICEMMIKDNLNPEFILHQSRLLEQIENRLNEVQTIMLMNSDSE
jgi:hypothetical protein